MAGFRRGTHAQYAQIRNSIKSDSEVVEAVVIEPTSGNPQPQASTSIVGLPYDSLALRISSRQEVRGASLVFLAPPPRPGSEPAFRI